MNLAQLIITKSKSDPHDVQTERLVTFVNPYSYLLARDKVAVFSQFDDIYIDGISLVVLFQLFGSKHVKRASFDYTSVGKTVLEDLNSTGKSLYIIGSTSLAIEQSVNSIKEAFPQINIIGFRNGFFEGEEERNKSILEIEKLNPDVVIVGMGTPLQEQFLIDLRNKGWKGTGYTCGGFIHQSAEKLNYYPKIFDQLNIRWIYRLIKEPRLFKRYFYYYPKSFVRLLGDLRF